MTGIVGILEKWVPVGWLLYFIGVGVLWWQGVWSVALGLGIIAVGLILLAVAFWLLGWHMHRRLMNMAKEEKLVADWSLDDESAVKVVVKPLANTGQDTQGEAAVGQGVKREEQGGGESGHSGMSPSGRHVDYAAEAMGGRVREQRVGFIETPLGVFSSKAYIGTARFESAHPDEMQVFGKKGRMLTWRAEQSRIELLWAPFIPELPDNLKVSGCIALIWRLRAEMTLGQATFECSLDGLPPEIEPEIDLTPLVYAVTWTHAASRLTMGAEGVETLDQRAWKGKGLPQRIAPRISNAMVETFQNGLRIVLPPLIRGERCQIHFIVSWSRQCDPVCPATRKAVDFLAQLDF